MPPIYSSSPGVTTRCVLCLLAHVKEPEHRASAALPRPKHGESYSGEPGPSAARLRAAPARIRIAGGRGWGARPLPLKLRAWERARRHPTDGSTEGREAPPPSPRWLPRWARARSRPPPPARQKGPAAPDRPRTPPLGPGAPANGGGKRQRRAMPSAVPHPRSLPRRPGASVGRPPLGGGRRRPGSGPAPGHRKRRPARPSPALPAGQAGPGPATP